MAAILSRLFSSRRELPPQVELYRQLVGKTDRKAPLEETEFVAFDTELTGTDFAKDSLISIGAVRLRGARLMAGQSFYRLVRPESRLKRRSVPVHELTHADLAEAEEPAAVLADFLEFIGGAVLVGHFVNVDLNFVNRSLKRHFGITLGNPAVDTSAVHEWLYDNDSTFKRHFGGATVLKDLYSMARSYGVEPQKSHNAFNDAYLTAQLFQRFLHFLARAGVRRLDELLSVGKF
ncbi:MAG: exonuclease domain-containing protein [Nitrospirota bacterium]